MVRQVGLNILECIVWKKMQSFSKIIVVCKIAVICSYIISAYKVYKRKKKKYPTNALL